MMTMHALPCVPKQTLCLPASTVPCKAKQKCSVLHGPKVHDSWAQFSNFRQQGLQLAGRHQSCVFNMAASTALDQFKGDLLATIKFVASMSSMPNYDTIRQIQADALTKRAAGLCLDPEAGAALANSWKSGPWSDDQTKAFSEVLARGVGATSGSTGKKGRRDNQMATSFESYLSENDVQVLGSDASIGIKLDCVATRC